MLDVPHLRQRTAWSCGPACARMILAYHGIEEAEADLADMLGTTSDNGTSPQSIAMYLRKRHLRVQARSGRSLEDLAASCARLRPVLVAYQAWGPPNTDYATCHDHGHYAVVVGVDRGRVYLVDPSSKRPRISFTESEFVSRWRDLSPDATRRYLQWGLSVGPRKSRKD